MNLCNKKGFSPLHVEFANEHDRVVQQLINNSDEMNLCNKEGFSPVYFACENEHENIVQH